MKINKLYPSLLLFLTWACDDSSSSHSPAPLVQAPARPVIAVATPAPVSPSLDPQTAAPEDRPSEISAGATTLGPGTATLGLVPGLHITRSQLLMGYGRGISQRTAEFATEANALHQEVQAYCSDLSLDKLESARTRFHQAMSVWQHLELYPVGPLAEANSALKYKIYGWPQLANYCQIDSESLLASTEADYALPTNTNRKGLQAIEYLLFETSFSTICPSSNPITAEWNALDTNQKAAARCSYLKLVSDELVTHAEDLQTRWGTASDNVYSRIVGQDEAEQAAIQDIFSNLFYLDLQIKNQKLAAPAGLDKLHCNKTPSPCPDKEELKYSKTSKAALDANFEGLADVIFGFPNPSRQGGLSAYIRQQGGVELAQRTESEVTALLAGSLAAGSSLNELIVSKQAEDCEISQVSWLCKVRTQIKALANDFKNEYAAILKTTVPAAPQGDND